MEKVFWIKKAILINYVSNLIFFLSHNDKTIFSIRFQELFRNCIVNGSVLSFHFCVCRWKCIFLFNKIKKGILIYIIVLAAWPSGKAGDCKSFFPSSNPGVAWSTRELNFDLLIKKMRRNINLSVMISDSTRNQIKTCLMF